MRPDPMVITLPVGTYFKALGSSSDMIARRDGVVTLEELSLIHISEPTRLGMIS